MLLNWVVNRVKNDKNALFSLITEPSRSDNFI